MESKRDLLFGALAVQAGLIDSDQLIEVCKACEARPEDTVENVLLERGWIAPADQAHLSHLLQRTLEKTHEDQHGAVTVMPAVVRQSRAALPCGEADATVLGVPTRVSGQTATLIPREALDTTSRYAFTHIHGTGGIGRVWQGRDGHLDREVAIKELLPTRAAVPRIARRFLREARLTAQLQHPGIVPVYELAARAGSNQPFYTMRLVRGRTLSAAIAAHHAKRREGKADSHDFVALLTAFVAVCNTIAYAHSRGVLHRDLKGENVVLGDFGEVIVLDWGLAKTVGQSEDEDAGGAADKHQDPTLTMQGEVVGTPAYMAPEQAEGRLDQIDQRTDIYGLGAILYEILAGQPPFVGSNTMEVLQKVMRGHPAPPQEIAPDAPPALAEICLKALAKNPAQRHALAADLGLEVQGWQDNERRRAEDALRRQTEILRSVLNSMSEGVVCADAAGNFILVNSAAERMFARLGTTLGASAAAHEYFRDDLVTPLDPRELPLQQAIDGAQVDDMELLARPRGGAAVWTSCNARPLRDEAGRAQGGLVVFRDITERKRAERRLTAQHTVSRILAESPEPGEAIPKILAALCEALNWSVGAMWQVDAAADVLRLSHFWRAPGVVADEFEVLSRRTTFAPGIGLPGRVWASGQPAWIRDVAQDSNFPRAPAAARHALHGALAFPIRSQMLVTNAAGAHDSGMWGGQVGAVFEFFSAAIEPPDEDLLRMLGSVGSQIGQFLSRKQAREALRRSEERFELAVKGSQDGLWDWDLITGAIYYSPRWKSILGYEDHEIAPSIDEWEARLHPHERDRVLAANLAHIEGKTPHYEYEYRLRHKDGSYRWILARGVALRDGSGKAYRMAGSHVDITERKAADEERDRLLAALRASEEQSRSLADLIPGIVWTARADGWVDYANQFWFDFTGLTLEQTQGSGWTAVVHPEDLPRVVEVWGRSLQCGEPVQTEYRVRRVDGVYRRFLARARSVRDGKGLVVKWFGMLTEIEEGMA